MDIVLRREFGGYQSTLWYGRKEESKSHNYVVFGIIGPSFENI